MRISYDREVDILDASEFIAEVERVLKEKGLKVDLP